MDLDTQAKVKAHARAIAALLYDEAQPEQLQTLEGIEETVRGQVLEHVTPEIGNFLSQLVATPLPDAPDASIASSAH